MRLSRSIFLAAAVTLASVAGVSIASPVMSRSAPLARLHSSAISPLQLTMARIYLIALNDGGRTGKRIGCGDSVVPVWKYIGFTYFTNNPLADALRLLLADHIAYYGQSGLYNALYQARLTVSSAVVRNGRATIRLGGKMIVRGVCDDPRVDAQLKQTARQFPSVKSVAIFVNGIPLWKLLSGKG
jgi:Sporulation and spore germination